MSQTQHTARDGPSHRHAACFTERQKHHFPGLDPQRRHGATQKALDFIHHAVAQRGIGVEAIPKSS